MAAGQMIWDEKDPEREELRWHVVGYRSTSNRGTTSEEQTIVPRNFFANVSDDTLAMANALYLAQQPPFVGYEELPDIDWLGINAETSGR